MSKIYKIFLFCCSNSDEAKQEIESENKYLDQSKVVDKTDLEKEAIGNQKPNSEDNPNLHQIDDSSESLSISSGEVS